jgi:hypothetical protein
MGNLPFRSFKTSECCECNEEINYTTYSDNGVQYLAYIIGKGKYSNRYYCLNCLDKLMKKNR